MIFLVCIVFFGEAYSCALANALPTYPLDVVSSSSNTAYGIGSWQCTWKADAVKPHATIANLTFLGAIRSHIHSLGSSILCGPGSLQDDFGR